MQGRAGYFGEGPLLSFGVVDGDGGSRGAVVLCKPLGYEAITSHATYRLLSERLAAEGFTCMRMDYPGTGNSPSGDTDPGAWPGAVHAAVDLLRSAGFDSVTLLGTRLGATVAAQVAAEREDVSGLVLWDPVDNGRRYTRSLKMLAASSEAGTVEPDGPVSVAGLTFTPTSLRTISGWRLPSPRNGTRVLRVVPAESEADVEPSEDVVVLPGTAAALDTDVELSQIPVAIVDAVVSWCCAGADVAGSASSSVELHPSVVVEHGGRRLRHEVRRVGEQNLFGILTSLEGSEPENAVLMVNNGASPQVGPGRAWVSWADLLAPEGYSVLRLDVHGLGESPPTPASGHLDAYPPEAGHDMLLAAQDLRSTGAQHVTALGLCSGALLAFDALKVGAPIDSVVSLNGRFDRPWAEPRPVRRTRAAGGTIRPLAFALSKGPLFGLFDRVPTAVWWLLDLLGLHRSPARSLEVAARRDVATLLVFGPEEWGLRALRRRSPRRFRHLVDDGRLTVSVVPGLDHSMFRRAERETVLEQVRDFLARTTGRSSAGQQRVVEAELPGTGPRPQEGVQ